MKKITKEGYEKLKKELEYLETKEKTRVAKALKDAIEEGDISESASYEDAKEQQSQLEAKIKEIKNTLTNSTIVEGNSNENNGKIGIGSTLKVETPAKTEKILTITGKEEADPSEGKISYDSPLGSAFLNKKEGEEVEVDTPGGKKTYKILELQK